MGTFCRRVAKIFLIENWLLIVGYCQSTRGMTKMTEAKQSLQLPLYNPYLSVRICGTCFIYTAQFR